MAALEGGLVTNAVNIPVVGAEELEVLGPYIPLASRLGRIAMELADGVAEEIVITALRRSRGARHAPAHRGRAQRRVPGAGRSAGQLRQRAAHRCGARGRSAGGALAYGTRLHDLLRVEVRAGERSAGVAGTTIGSENRLWLVNVLGFEIDLELAPLFVLCRYDDVPGVIGRVGTLFGAAGINIAAMTVSRSRQGGKALMALTVDSPPPAELVARLRSEGFDDARVIEL